MKAITAVCSTGASVPSIANGRVSRHRDNGENAEIQMYISKLKDLVPFMPKNRKLSKLEVIQNVIQYICDLQTALDADPAVNDFDAAAVLATQNHLLEVVSPRQPLHVRPSPNTILPSTNNTSPTLIPASQHMYGTSNDYSSINHNVSVTSHIFSDPARRVAQSRQPWRWLALNKFLFTGISVAKIFEKHFSRINLPAISRRGIYLGSKALIRRCFPYRNVKIIIPGSIVASASRNTHFFP